LDRVLGRIDDLDAQNLAILARRLERERDLMETVLDTLREGVLVLSHDGAIEYANASAVRLLGVSQEDVNGAELRRLSPDIALALELPETVGALTRELEVRYPEPRLLNLHLTRVGEVGEIASCGFASAGGDVAALGQVDRRGGHLGEFARHGGDWLEIVDLHRARRAEGDGLRQDEREFLIFSAEDEREDEEAESEVLHGKGWS